MARDVVIIGAGPVGLTMALLLARHGLRVEVFEKRLKPSSEARAVSVDDESLRIWQGCGVGDVLSDDIASGEPGQCVCTYFDAAGRSFLKIHQRESDLGHPLAAAIHQGRIDEKLMRTAQRHPSIQVHLGCSVRTLQQSEHAVVVGFTDVDGRASEIEASWAIACDGAGSTVRQALAIPSSVTTLPHPWLVANLVDHGEPGHVEIRCRPDGASVTMPMPHGVRRVEVRLAESDRGEWLSDPGEVSRRLAQGWAGSPGAAVIGSAIHRFKTAMAARWREGRVFLAGDAAHVMPPFAGQGLCAGLRDAANLSFKIAGVCQGWLAPGVLDTYEAERRPHVERITRLACRLGRLMSPRTTLEAKVLHSALRLLGSSRTIAGRWLLRGPAIQPVLSAGFLVPSALAGRYLPQPRVFGPDNRPVPLDTLLGPRMTWIALAGRSGSTPPLQSPLLQPSDSVLVEGRDFRDPERALQRRYGAGSLIFVRPDRVVCYHARPTRFRSINQRRVACLPDIAVIQEVREVSSSGPRSLPAALADASPTVPIPV